MARLSEVAVKDILSSQGVARPAGLDGATAAEISAGIGALTPPLYVKAQVPIGDRAAIDAVRRVADHAGALEAASDMLGTSYGGRPCRRVLVEEGLEGGWMGYAAVRVDDALAARVVTVSRNGGAGFDPGSLEPLLQLSSRIEAHEIRSALERQGFRSAELQHLADFVERLCRAARDWCTYLIEVNPFLWTPDGVVALDGKAEVDDYSASLLPSDVEIEHEELDPREQQALHAQRTDHQGTLRYVQLIAETDTGAGPCVGSHAVGGGESMIIMDALADVGLEPTNYCDTSGSPSREKVAVATELIAGQPHISGYFFSSCIANQPLSVTAAGMVDGFRAAGWVGPTVARIAGNEEAEAIAILRAWGDTVTGPVQVFGRETDEWAAAEALAEMVRAR